MYRAGFEGLILMFLTVYSSSAKAVLSPRGCVANPEHLAAQ